MKTIKITNEDFDIMVLTMFPNGDDLEFIKVPQGDLKQILSSISEEDEGEDIMFYRDEYTPFGGTPRERFEDFLNDLQNYVLLQLIACNEDYDGTQEEIEEALEEINEAEPVVVIHNPSKEEMAWAIFKQFPATSQTLLEFRESISEDGYPDIIMEKLDTMNFEEFCSWYQQNKESIEWEEL